MKKIGLLAFFSVLLSSACLADIHELYEEERIHNAKLEKRLADWVKSAQQHSHALNHSNSAEIVRWRQQLASLNHSDPLVFLERLNTFINGDVIYVDDYHHYGKEDFWADPETTLLEGGDCEDIALLKAASLYHLRWPANRMHLLVGYLVEDGRKESHAVLLVETSEGWQRVLRSITNQVVEPGEFPFVPIYAVDQEGTLIVKPPAHLRPRKAQMLQ